MKLIPALLAILIISALSFSAWPENPHHPAVNGIDGAPGSDAKAPAGTALGLATAQHQFDWDTYQLQSSIGVGTYDGAQAISYGMARRLCPTCGKALVSGSVGAQEGKKGVGAGITWRW